MGEVAREQINYQKSGKKEQRAIRSFFIIIRLGPISLIFLLLPKNLHNLFQSEALIHSCQKRSKHWQNFCSKENVSVGYFSGPALSKTPVLIKTLKLKNIELGWYLGWNTTCELLLLFAWVWIFILLNNK